MRLRVELWHRHAPGRLAPTQPSLIRPRLGREIPPQASPSPEEAVFNEAGASGDVQSPAHLGRVLVGRLARLQPGAWGEPRDAAMQEVFQPVKKAVSLLICGEAGASWDRSLVVQAAAGRLVNRARFSGEHCQHQLKF